MPTTTPTRRGLAASMLLLAVVLGGCEDDPIADDHDDEPEVGGFVLTSGTVELYRYTDADAAQPDTLFLTSGQTYDVVVHWLDHDGAPTELEEGLELRVEVAHPAIATFTVTGAASGTLVAGSVLQPVATSMRVQLWHEAEQHEDFESLFFPVKVSP